MVPSGDVPSDFNLASFSSGPSFEFFNTIRADSRPSVGAPGTIINASMPSFPGSVVSGGISQVWCPPGFCRHVSFTDCLESSFRLAREWVSVRT